MNKYVKAGLALLLMVFVCCSYASAGAVEELNVTYQLGGTYINAEAVASARRSWSQKCLAIYGV